MVEATVVPRAEGDTEQVALGASGAVLSCTIPSGVAVAAGGQVIGSVTNAITAAMCDPVTALSTNAWKVTQYYYKALESSAYMLGPNQGCFVWHDVDWTNVAYSNKPFDDKTAVFGDPSLADVVCITDVRGHPIQYLWNTRGSYAIDWTTSPLVVNTLEDQLEAEMDLRDQVVTLREAFRLIQEIPVVRNPDGTPNKITFSDDLFKFGSAATISLWLKKPLSIVNRQAVSDPSPIWLCGPGNGRTVTIDGCGSQMFVFGAGIRARASDLTFTNGRSSGNDSDGAVFTCRGALESLERCTFWDNKGSAVWIDQDPLVVSGCTFTGNGGFELEDGGAIHHWNANHKGTGVVTVVDSVFENNTAHVGGAICSRGELHVSGSTFRGNEMTANGWGGGAIWNRFDAPATVATSVFEGNRSAADGGALRVDSVQGGVEIEKSSFVGNTAAANGGALSAPGPVTLTGVSFEENEADDDGGAVWMTDRALTVGQSRFASNIAQLGGAVRAAGKGSPVFIEETSFVGNRANALDGGALSVEGKGSGRLLTVLNASFLDNRAMTGGGAICQSGCNAVLVNVTFRGNSTASGPGGAYRGWAAQNELLSVVNVIASGNSAPKDATADDFAPGNAGIFAGYSSAIKAIKGVSQIGGNQFWTGNAAGESAVFQNATGEPEERIELVNLAIQTAERLRSTYGIVHAGAVIEHDVAWTNIVCNPAGTESYYALRGDTRLTRRTVRTDITGRAYADGVKPCMGCLWDVEDPPSKTVTTLLDVEDPTDGRTSLREVVGHLATSEEWRSVLYNASVNAYDVQFAAGLAGELRLEGGALEIPALDAAGVFVHVPGNLKIAIDGQQAARAFSVREGGILDLANLTIRNCCGKAYGTESYDGGAIANAGTLNVSNVAFYACTAGPTNMAPAGSGGAVAALAGSTTRLRGCTFAGCTALRGGAVSVGDGATFTVCNSTFVSNAVLNVGGVRLARGNALYVSGASTDALIAQCTFANNVGQDHLDVDGAAAVYVDNADTKAARVSVVNSVLLGNGKLDVATSGRVRLVGSVYGLRDAVETCTDPWCAAYSKFVTEEQTTADVYAHTTSDGSPLSKTVDIGPVSHVVFPLLSGATQPSVSIRASLGWLAAGWGSTEDRIDDVFRGTRIGALYSDLWSVDQTGATATTNWLGAVIAREAKSLGDPDPSGPLKGVVTEATYASFAQTLRAAMTAVSDDIVITVADNVKKIDFEGEIVLDKPKTLTIRGPLTLDAHGCGRFFSVGRGVTLRLVDVTLQNGNVWNESSFGIGGAVLLDNTFVTKLAAIEAYNCTFRGCRANAGGAIYANGLGCSETFVGCTFEDNCADADMGAAIYHDDMNLTLTDTKIDLDDIWPRPEVALELGTGAYALFTDPDGGTGAAALQAAADEATATAAARGVSANVRYLSFAAAKAVGGEAAVEAMTPVAEAMSLATSGDGDEKVVTMMPKNVVPYMWYALEHAETPVGPFTAEPDGWVQANPDGTLPRALTAPAEGASGFYRIVVRE